MLTGLGSIAIIGDGEACKFACEGTWVSKAVISSSDTKLNDSFSSPLYCSIAIQFKVLDSINFSSVNFEPRHPTMF